MPMCWWCGAKMSEAEIEQSFKYLEEGMLCSKHLAEEMGWLAYGDIKSA